MDHEESAANGNIDPIQPSSTKTTGDSPSTRAPEETMEDELKDFRDKWQRELKITPNPDPNSNDDRTRQNVETESIEERSKMFYLTAVEMEKTGKMFDAVKFYKKAFDLIPDIDHRLFRSSKASNNNPDEKQIQQKVIKKNYKGDLVQKIQNKISGVVCVPKNEQNTTHISVLPIELLLYILRWVVSEELDLRSLEMFGQVCRGFYLCARDSEIWKLACIKVWGPSCKLEHFSSWRQMFLDRARLQFNGCYISKTTYIRHGENSFQDQFYRPWHLITYYRYFRFFPEGTVLVLTTPDEPNVCVSQLKSRSTSKSPVLAGYYRLKDDLVRITVHRQENSKVSLNFKRNNRRELHVPSEQTFEMELKILNHKNKKHIQLQWSHYSIRTRSKGDENVCVFDLANSKFPPLWFSRVKSYAIESEAPLN